MQTTELEISGWSNLKEWLVNNAATLLLTVSVTIAGWFVTQMTGEIGGIRSEIKALNKTIREMATQQAVHRELIRRNNKEIDRIEEQVLDHSDNWEERWRKDSSIRLN